jgi:hypothetical protein
MIIVNFEQLPAYCITGNIDNVINLMSWQSSLKLPKIMVANISDYYACTYDMHCIRLGFGERDATASKSEQRGICFLHRC